jgi:hypothetical protein
MIAAGSISGVRLASLGSPSAGGNLWMQAKGFFASLFDYSFSSFVTPKIIKLLYVLMTILVALATLLLILRAFKSSTGAGILVLLVVGPIFFVISMIYVRVGLELLIVFFRIHGDVQEINLRGGAGNPSASPVSPSTEPALAPASPAEPPSTAAPEARFCANCGTEQSPGKRFCTVCGAAVE